MKNFFIVLLILIFCATVGICIVNPIAHKQFAFSVVDYLIKFNTDGSMTTVKQTTTTKVQKEDEK